jgi:uncharacterized lipoprotein YajG
MDFAMKNIVEVARFSLAILWTFCIVGCTTVYKPTYTPTDIFYEDLRETPIKLRVHDDRGESERVFYKDYPIAISENSKSGIKLEPSSREIIEQSLIKAMDTSGYLLSEDAPTVMDVAVKEFIWRFNHYAIIFGQSFTVDIKLEVTVKKNDRILIKKTIAETVERKPPISHLGQEESMLSECLTKAVERLISDHNIIAAIRRGYKDNTIEKESKNDQEM